MSVKNLILTILFISFLSCQKELNQSINGGRNEVVVNATLNPDSFISARLYKSKNILDSTNYEFENNAVIYVFENEQLVDTLKNSSNGFYIGSTKPKAEMPYSFHIKTTNNITISGCDTVPEIVKIQTVETIVEAVNPSVVKCVITFTDPARLGNCYFFKIFSSNSSDSITKQIPSYEFYDTYTQYQNFEGTIFFNDEAINGNSHSLLVTMDYPKHTVVNFQLWSVSRTLFNYYSVVYSNKSNNGLLFTNKIELKSNVIGGLGIVGAYSISSIKISFK